MKQLPSDIRSDSKPNAGAGVFGARTGFAARLKQLTEQEQLTPPQTSPGEIQAEPNKTQATPQEWSQQVPKSASIVDPNEVWSWYRGDNVNSIESGDQADGDDVASWRARFPGWLARWYKDPALEQRLQKLNVDIQWVSFPKAGDQVAALQIGVGGATVVDDGRALVMEAGKSASAAAMAQRAVLMVEIAKTKGWSTLNVKGDPQFVAAVRAAADDAGLGVSAVNGKAVAHAQPQPRGPGM